MSIFRLPDLGEGLQEAEIVAWHVSVGDHVVVDQPLVSVETDKAVVEVPCPASGTVRVLNGDVGAIIQVGEPLAEISEAGKSENALPQKPSEVDASTSVVGHLPTDAGSSKSKLEQPAPSPRDKAQAMPAVRALAKEKGIDLSQVTGTGPDGIVTRSDVESFGQSTVQIGEVPLTGPRRAMARRMSQAGAEIVPATVNCHVDIQSWWAADADITVRLARAMAVAAASEPTLNAWYISKNGSRILHQSVDLGLAVDHPDGLFVGVARHIENKSLPQLRVEIDGLLDKIDKRTVTHDDMWGATISLSNFGVIFGETAALVIPPPQVAIVGAGRIQTRLVLEDDKAVNHHFLPLSLSFDHRVVTGGEAARFLKTLHNDLALMD